jgi:hypothetical protein
LNKNVKECEQSYFHMVKDKCLCQEGNFSWSFLTTPELEFLAKKLFNRNFGHILQKDWSNECGNWAPAERANCLNDWQKVDAVRPSFSRVRRPFFLLLFFPQIASGDENVGRRRSQKSACHVITRVCFFLARAAASGIGLLGDPRRRVEESERCVAAKARCSVFLLIKMNIHSRGRATFPAPTARRCANEIFTRTPTANAASSREMELPLLCPCWETFKWYQPCYVSHQR